MLREDDIKAKWGAKFEWF